MADTDTAQNDQKEALDFITGYITSHIQNLPNVVNVSLSAFPPCTPQMLDKWEMTLLTTTPTTQRSLFLSSRSENFQNNDGTITNEGYSCRRRLPDDLKSFYSISNGLSFTWSVREGVGITGDKDVVSVGCIKLSPLQSLIQIPLWNEDENDAEDDTVAFAIESHEDYGVVALVYGFEKRSERLYRHDKTCCCCRSSCRGHDDICVVKAGEKKTEDDETDSSRQCKEETPSVWFLDKSCRWHLIAHDFTSYLRVSLAHLGILGWQYAFTDIGLDPRCRYWMQRYAPERLVVDLVHSKDVFQEGIF